jgi:hypothetical protein
MHDDPQYCADPPRVRWAGRLVEKEGALWLLIDRLEMTFEDGAREASRLAGSPTPKS